MQDKAIDKNLFRAVILAGPRDFGRCPIASRLPTALWPICDKPVLTHLLEDLASQGLERAVVCSNGDAALFNEAVRVDGIEVDLFDEALPVGTAGCIRDAAVSMKEHLLVVAPASIVSPPKIDELLSLHADGAGMTVLFNPAGADDRLIGDVTGIYVCNPDILKYIPQDGYYDIKEGLIPDLVASGMNIRTVTLPHCVGAFRNRPGYLLAVAAFLEDDRQMSSQAKISEKSDSHLLWLADTAQIDPTARIYGRVVVMDNARISEGVTIFGPAVVGQNCIIAGNTLVVNSVLWDDAHIGARCEVRHCLLDYGAKVPAGTAVSDKSIAFRADGAIVRSAKRVLTAVENSTAKIQGRLTHVANKPGKTSSLPEKPGRALVSFWLGGIVVLLAFLWSFWDGIVDLWNVWQKSDEYSSGLLVPFLAVYVLWSRRDELRRTVVKPCLWGLAAVVLAFAVRFFGLFFMYGSAERFSVVLCIAALVLFLFGRQFFRKSWPILLFLCLMLPWPHRVQAAVTLPLQRWATSSAVFCLEMLGYDVLHDGNIIHIGNTTVAVAEACNGLRMVTAFFVISALVVLLVRRAWWEKLIILASSLPIALLCNSIRLTVTAVAFTIISGQRWEKIFHDFGGYAMIPLALALIMGELSLLSKLTTAPAQAQRAVVIRHRNA